MVCVSLLTLPLVKVPEASESTAVTGGDALSRFSFVVLRSETDRVGTTVLEPEPYSYEAAGCDVMAMDATLIVNELVVRVCKEVPATLVAKVRVNPVPASLIMLTVSETSALLPPNDADPPATLPMLEPCKNGSLSVCERVQAGACLHFQAET